MAQPNFDYEGALDAGYSESEINDFLRQQPTYRPTNQPKGILSNVANNAANFIGNFGNPTGQQQPQQKQPQQASVDQKLLKHSPNFDMQGALEAGYSPDEINEFLQQRVPERSVAEKGGRLATQYGLGVLQGTPSGLAYDIATAPLASKEAQTVAYKQNVMEDIEQMADQKQNASRGLGEWTQNDEDLFQNLQEQIKHPEKAEPFVKTADISIRGLAQQAAAPLGVDLEPEGVLEKAANWAGFIKSPKNLKNLATIGLTPKTLMKGIFPGPTEAIRGLAAGAALQMAEEGNYGPAGTIAAAVAGDLIGHGPKALFNVVTQPRKTLAQATDILTKAKNRLVGGNSDKEWIKQLVDDANKAGVQLDAGTLTNSNEIRMAQARAAQSGLSGPALDEFRKNLSQQIVKRYEEVIGDLGTLSFENNHQASEAIRNFVSKEGDEIRFYRQREHIPGEQREGRPLAGRVATEARPAYQEELLNQIAPQEFRNSYEAGETLKTAAEDIKAPIKEEFNHRFESLNREVETLPGEPHPELARVLENFVEEQRGSLLLGESSAENRVLQAATRLRNELMTEDGAFRGVRLRDLIKTKRTLGDIANWEFGGSNFQGAYKQIVGQLDQAIERSLGEINPALRGAYEQLNAEYSMFKDVFENKNVLPLFEPKNQNYNTIYNGFLKSPDKIRSLEDMMFNSPRGQQLVNQMKRDYAQRIIENPRTTGRELRDLSNVLGPQYEEAIQNFIGARHRAIEQPLPRAARQSALGGRVEIPEARAARPLTGRGVPKAEQARRKLFEYIKAKSSDQILKMMDTPEGIHKLKKLSV